jgi:hypothetical protein
MKLWEMEYGQRLILLKMLETKFGPLSQKIQKSLSIASFFDLEKIADKILTANTPDELFTSMHFYTS